MEIPYNRLYSVFFFAISVGAFIYYGDQKMWVGALFLAIAVFLVTRKYLYVRNNSITVKTIIGTKSRRISFDSFADLSVDNNIVYLNKSGKSEKLPVSKSFANGAEWKQFTEKIKQGKL